MSQPPGSQLQAPALPDDPRSCLEESCLPEATVMPPLSCACPSFPTVPLTSGLLQCPRTIPRGVSGLSDPQQPGDRAGPLHPPPSPSSAACQAWPHLLILSPKALGPSLEYSVLPVMLSGTDLPGPSEKILLSGSETEFDPAGYSQNRLALSALPHFPFTHSCLN